MSQHQQFTSLACLPNPDVDCEIQRQNTQHQENSVWFYLSSYPSIYLSLCTKVLWLWPRCAESYLSGSRGFHRGSTARSARSANFGRWQLRHLLKEHITRQTDWKSCWVEMVGKSSELWLEERSSWLWTSKAPRKASFMWILRREDKFKKSTW